MSRFAPVSLLLSLGLLAACGGAGSAPESDLEMDAFVAHGEAIYEVAGCVSCHGAPGDAAPADDMPSLDPFVARFGLDAETRAPAMEWILSGAVHDQSRDDERPFVGFEQFVITTRLYEELITGGGHDGPFERMELADPMPAWGDTLSQRDVDAVLAYLIAVGVE